MSVSLEVSFFTYTAVGALPSQIAWGLLRSDTLWKFPLQLDALGNGEGTSGRHEQHLHFARSGTRVVP